MTTYNECVHHAKSMNEQKDCTVKALAITTSIGYLRAHKILKIMGRKSGRGLRSKSLVIQIKKMQTAVKLADRIVGSAQFPEGLTMNTVGERYKQGSWLVFTASHCAALVNGTVQDWSEGKRHRVKWLLRVGV